MFAHFIDERVGDIPTLEEQNKPHRVSDSASKTHSLCASHGDIDDHPEH